MKHTIKTAWMSLTVVLLLTFLLAACSDGDDGGGETPPPVPESKTANAAEPTENRVITIGNHIDLTGPGSNPHSIILEALEDIVGYYNEHNLIPGVELEIVSFDNQYEPSRDLPGYEWLKDKGADLILANSPSTAISLKPAVEQDGMVVFAMAPDEEALVPPGYVFAGSNALAKHLAYTLLEWVAANDPDFPEDRPARIGGASWHEGHSESFFASAEEYAEAHPDQYEWVGGHLTDYSFTWSPEVEALKDCDYVLPPTMIVGFAKEYRSQGHTAKFIGHSWHLAFMQLVDDADIWEELDGMLVMGSTRWWNEEGEIINLAKRLLEDNHSAEEAQEIMGAGGGYLATNSLYVMLEVIADAVEAVGPENFSSQALYEAAQSYSKSLDGLEFYTFSETQRAPLNYFGMYEIRAAEEDVVRIVPEWIPVVYSP